MAITKTTTVRSTSILFPRKRGGERSTAVIQADLLDTWDDPEDEDLPLSKARQISIESGQDTSEYPQFVQDLAAWLYSS